MINPLGIKHAMDVKDWISKNPVKCIAKHIEIVKSPDGSGFVSIFQFKFATEKEAQMFNEVYKLAEQYGV